MAEQYSSATTTADSAAEGRLKVGAGCQHGKKKCLKCAIKDGKGGFRAPGYGKPPAKSYRSAASLVKPPKAKKISGGKKLPGLSTLMKKSKYSSSLKSKKKKSLKSMLKVKY